MQESPFLEGKAKQSKAKQRRRDKKPFYIPWNPEKFHRYYYY
jgi:hypothetical protein